MIHYKANFPIQTEDIEKIIKPPIIVTVNDFDDGASKKFAEEMQKAYNTGQPIIPVVVDSYGGEAYALLNMIDTMMASPVPVATVVKGKAMSCGSFLAAFGSKGYRYISPRSVFMVHEVGGWAMGKVEEIKADAVEKDRLNTTLFRQLAEYCGHNKKFFLNKIHEKNHADWFINAEEALELSLADHIRIPKYEIELEYNVSFN